MGTDAKQRARSAASTARKALYTALRKDGIKPMQAAGRLGMGESTMRTYERAFQLYIAEEATKRAAASKDQVIARLSEALLDLHTPVAYLSSLAGKLADMQGWNSTKRIELSDLAPRKPIADLLKSWRSERAVTVAEPEPDVAAALTNADTPYETVPRGETKVATVETVETDVTGAIPPGGGDEIALGSSPPAHSPQSDHSVTSGKHESCGDESAIVADIESGHVH